MLAREHVVKRAFVGSKDFREACKAERAQSLKPRNRKDHRGPLHMWMACAKPVNGSKIIGLCDESSTTIWGWGAWNASSFNTAIRLAERHRLTKLQRDVLLYRFLAYRYPGRVSGDIDYRAVGLVGDSTHPKMHAVWLRRLADTNMEMADIMQEYLCLRVLLSPLIGSLILANQLRRIV